MNIEIEPTKVYFDTLKAFNAQKFKTFCLQGGSSSSKTFSTLQLLITLALQEKLLISVVSESMPHLKRGAIRDFLKILGITKYDRNWNCSDSSYVFKNGSQIEFFSADNAAKLRGARRDILFINECNRLDFESYLQLSIRTHKYVFLDWNPEIRFWAHKNVITQSDTFFHISNHFDNHKLALDERQKLERMKHIDWEWYRVYGLGLVGQYQGIVFKNYEVKDLTQVYNTLDSSDLRYGVDFGYFPDPAAFIISAKIKNTIYIFKEILANDIDNEELATLVKPWSQEKIVWCDSSEPKSIKELRKHNINARGVGGKDRQYSISWLKRHKIIIHSQCKKTIEEIETFSRKKDKQGNVLPIFEDKNDHLIDALRYAFKSDIGSAQVKSLHLSI